MFLFLLNTVEDSYASSALNLLQYLDVWSLTIDFLLIIALQWSPLTRSPLTIDQDP